MNNSNISKILFVVTLDATQFNREEIRQKLLSSWTQVAKECVSTGKKIYASKQSKTFNFSSNGRVQVLLLYDILF